jgi:hypothetical protein
MHTVREPGVTGTSVAESRYRAAASEGVNVDTSVCVIAKCKVYSRAVSESPINPIINPKPVYSFYSR